MPSSDASKAAVPPPNALFLSTGDEPEVVSSSSSFDAGYTQDSTPTPTVNHMRAARQHSVSFVSREHNESQEGGVQFVVGDEYDLDDTRPSTPRIRGGLDPFATPANGASVASLAFPSVSQPVSQAPSAPGSSLDLTALAGATASRLSILSSGYNFGALANGLGAGPAHSQSSGDLSALNIQAAAANGTVPPVPPIPNRYSHMKGMSNVSRLSVSSLNAPQAAPVPIKRESFASPPLLARPLSAAGAGVHQRRTSFRPGTAGTATTIGESTISVNEKAGDPLSPLNGAFPNSNDSSPPGTAVGSRTGDYSKQGWQRRMQSTALGPDEEPEKPWLKRKDARARASWWLTLIFTIVGFAASFLRCFFGAKDVQLIQGNLCLVLDDDFNGASLDTSKWGYEVELGGFGNGEFEMTTNSVNNTFIEDGVLYIVPTLTSDAIGTSAIFNAHTFNLTGCTSVNNTACGVVSNETTRTVINPVQSARLTTINSTSIQYGRVDVRARLPRGDWLWPAIWMLPVNNTYGPWPASGEIDIMESRGNAPSYPAQGSNYVRSALNWGPLSFLNEVSKTFGFWTERRTSYDQDFHIYTLEWTDKFIRAYVDTRLHFMLDLKFSEPFFKRGDFPQSVFNGSQEIPVTDPWPNNNVAPFDRPFYLILDVAVGGTTGWFPDGLGDKPWLDQSSTAMYDFARAQETWYDTWPTDTKQRGMAVDYVKMWQLC